jgi:hypothetical protein
MISTARRFFPRLLAVLVWECFAAHSMLFAQAPGNQKAEELIRSGERAATIGYILTGIGILIMVAAIPYGIYQDRKKKARKQAKLAARQRDNAASP